MQTAGTVIGPGQTAAWGAFGAMLLREDAGGYVLVAVVSFAAAAAITALCIRLRSKENRKKDGADKPTRHEKEETGAGSALYQTHRSPADAAQPEKGVERPHHAMNKKGPPDHRGAFFIRYFMREHTNSVYPAGSARGRPAMSWAWA